MMHVSKKKVLPNNFAPKKTLRSDTRLLVVMVVCVKSRDLPSHKAANLEIESKRPWPLLDAVFDRIESILPGGGGVVVVVAKL
jgi:hypothetical protein